MSQHRSLARSPGRIASACVSAVLACAAFAAPAFAQTEVRARTDQVRVVFDEPAEAKHIAIRDAMQERGIADVLRAVLTPFRLPRELTIEIKSCEGRETAYYDNGVATFCYEYVELIERHSPKTATPWGVARSDAIVGAIVDTILHEAGHGIFDILEVPVFGREEDAADFFSVYLLLQFPVETAQRLLQGAAFVMGSEGRVELHQKPPLSDLAGAHAFNAQRHFNLLCLAYGADPALLGNAMPPGMTQYRVENCADEFAMLKRAFTKLILPHVDEPRLRSQIASLRINWRPLSNSKANLDKPPLGE
jgi:hypothetical protein